MHHGYVQVRFGSEIKNCRRQQLTLLSGDSCRKVMARGRLRGVVGGLVSGRGDSETSSGDAESEVGPVSPVSSASDGAGGADGDSGAGEHSIEQC